MVAHNADFDMSFIKKNCQRLDIPCKPTIVDTVALARVLLPNLNRFKLDTVAKALGVSWKITIVPWMMPDVRQRFL